MGTPMVAPAFQQGAYWNQSPQTRKQSNSALWAVAIAAIGLFLTVLTLCVTLLLWQQQQRNQTANQGAEQPAGKFIAQEEAEPPPHQPAEQKAPQVVAEEPPAEVPPAASPAEIGRAHV